MPKRSIGERIAIWKRSLSDPLRTPAAAARWIASLPATDALQLQHEALDLVTSFPGGRRAIGPAQAEALVAHRRAVRARHQRPDRAVHGELSALQQRRDTPLARGVRSGQGVHRGVRSHGQERVRRPRGQAVEDRPAQGSVAACPLQGARRQVPAVSLRALDTRAMAGSPRAVRIRTHARLASRSQRHGVPSAQQDAGAGICRYAAADAIGQRQFHARPGRVGGARARRLGRHGDPGSAAWHQRKFSGRPVGYARTSTRRPAARRRPRSLPRCVAGVRQNRRAHARACRIRTTTRRWTAICRHASRSCC